MTQKNADLTTTVTLSNGVEMPILGLGVFKSAPGEETEQAVAWALEAGYRHIDTAAYYQNEADVGRALKGSGAGTGSGVFVTTKVWNSDQGYDSTLRAFEASITALGLTAVDLYLVHWPKPELMRETWRAMERIYDEKLARAIGVSNFQPHHLEDLAVHSNHGPTVNQIELHPYLSQEEVRAYCADHNIVVEGWSPLARGGVLNDPVLAEIAARHDASTAQVALRWALQHDIVSIPKSTKQERIISNGESFSLSLSHEEMARIDSLNRQEEGRIGPHPDNVTF